MSAGGRIRILCVDDEPNVLAALSLQLRKRFDVATAGGGEAGLEELRKDGPFAVVVSDMRMPGMDGAAFLSRVREISPDTVRVLLTGMADFDVAVSAVNQGQIFRFLSKPCPPEMFIGALTAAAEQHRLITSERVLLEQTLHGSVKALSDILSLAHPTAFGRATRVKQHVSEMAAHLGVGERWQMEVAAMLSQIGCITLPPQTVERLYHGQALSEAEEVMVARLPAVAEQLLANIPRLEVVREILQLQDRRFDGANAGKDGKRGAAIPLGSRLLKLIMDFDVLEAQGAPVDVALDTLRSRVGWYDPALLQAFAESRGNAGRVSEVHEMKLAALRPGMIFAEDVRARAGGLLVARGQEVTEGLLERMRNFSASLGVREPIRVIVRRV